MKVKTSELAGAALDWAVAITENWAGADFEVKPYSTNWSLSGPLIEREWIEVVPWPNESNEEQRWRATQHDTPIATSQTGPTPLIAAMRCYVASKLGDELDVPEEFVSTT